MGGNIEARLAAAAEQLREYEITALRYEQVRLRMGELERQLDSFRADHAAEQLDLDRLERLSLSRVLASLRGNREDRLARERAELDAARLRVGQVEAILDSVRREAATVEFRLRSLREAPTVYAAVLAEKERHLRESGDPRGQRLLALAEERGRLVAEHHELREAIHAAGVAQQALAVAQDRLGSAANWSGYDTFLGGGAISSAMKHSRLDEAADAAAQADRCLAVLRTELADVAGAGPSAPGLAVDQFTRFLDVWFDNIFTDLAVRSRIQQAQRNIDHSAHAVSQLRATLTWRASAARDRIAQLEAERHSLLTSEPG